MVKSDVNGDNANEVYKYLKSQKSGLLGLTRIKVCLSHWDAFMSISLFLSGTLKSFWSIRRVGLSTVGRRRQPRRPSILKSPSSFKLETQMSEATGATPSAKSVYHVE